MRRGGANDARSNFCERLAGPQVAASTTAGVPVTDAERLTEPRRTHIDIERPRVRANGRGDLCEKHAALYLGMTDRTLRDKRKAGIAPPHRMVYGRAWYPIVGLDEFMDTDFRE